MAESEPMDMLDEILSDRELDPRDKHLRLNRQLTELGEDGVEFSIAVLMEPSNELRAFYAARYLAAIPAHSAQKIEGLARLLANHPEWIAAGAVLVEFVDEELATRLARHVLDSGGKPGIDSIAYELAQHFPDLMREHRKALAPYDLDELLLPGAPQESVDLELKAYRENGDARHAVRLSYIRTDGARDALVRIYNGAPSTHRDFIAGLLESSGVFPDSRLGSVFLPSFRGLLDAPRHGAHSVDGDPPGPVPVGPVDRLPAERILELVRDQLPFKVRGRSNPSFFWYEGAMPPAYLYVRDDEKGLEGLMTPMGEPSGRHDLVSDACSVVLEQERHPFGLGGGAFAGNARIQVGGYPHWRIPTRFPRCPSCHQGMRFIASVSSGIAARAHLAFPGILYGFWCGQCNVSCTCRQT